jgi:hypothetical protein
MFWDLIHKSKLGQQEQYKDRIHKDSFTILQEDLTNKELNSIEILLRISKILIMSNKIIFKIRFIHLKTILIIQGMHLTQLNQIK